APPHLVAPTGSCSPGRAHRVVLTRSCSPGRAHPPAAAPAAAGSYPKLLPEPREGAATRVTGGVVQGLLDAQQLVVLGDPVGTGRGARLDLAAVRRHRQVGDR